MESPAWPHAETHRLALSALEHYDLPPAASVRPVRMFNNAVFEVSAGGSRFALRVHRPAWRGAAHIRSELAFLETLARQVRGTAVTVPAPVSTRDGDLVAEVDAGPGDTRYCSLLGWVDGQPLRPTAGLGPAAARLLGEALARVHVAGETFESLSGGALPRWDADGLFTDASPYLGGNAGIGALRDLMRPADVALLPEVADRTRQAFAALEREGGNAAGLIHNDFILGNCHLVRRRRGWQVGVIDFDDCGYGCFLFDLGAVLGNLADFRPVYPALRSAFLAGYRGVRPLSATAEAYLPLMMAARHVSHFLWALGRGRSHHDTGWVRHHLEVRAQLARHCLSLRR